MARKFWGGFTAGAVAGVAAAATSLLAWRTIARSRVRQPGILRLEKTLQIGCLVEQAFRAWSRLEELPSRTRMVQQVRCEGDRSHWTLNLGGRMIRWDAEVTQRIPNQAIGWKSISGPKHSGRIDFSPLGNDTLVHITMNYVPPGQMARLFSPIWGKLEQYIDQALRDFKASLEGKGQEERIAESAARRPAGSVTGSSAMNQAEQRGTGTFGAELDRHTQTGRFGGPESSVEYTRPPETKS
jgi:uncharacterized membrane protein